MTARVYAAVDLGASSGRVIAGVVDCDAVRLHPVYRFANAAREIDGHLRWDFGRLVAEVLVGLGRLAERFPQVESIGVDTWGVDYGLLTADGRLLADPISYRDERTTKVVEDVHRIISPDELFALNGLQVLPFNTLYQLAAEQREPLWSEAAHVVLLPDLLAYRLTGALCSERTIASTTGLLDVRTGDWSHPLLDRLGIRSTLLPPVEAPGTVRGAVRADLCEKLGLAPSTVVTTTAAHDTASAVVSVPATSPRFAYVSSGTWSLVGLELDAPVLTAEARLANFTNERGVDDRFRFLRNRGGLWLLQESLRTWALELEPLLLEAEELPSGGPTFDVDDPVFLAPGDMPARIAHACDVREMTPAETVRAVIDSLAAAYGATVRHAAMLANRSVEVVHIVGGGAQNSRLCQATADAAGLPVVAGPVEATAFGNVLVQARAHGAVPASLPELRACVAASSSLRTYQPS